jgi:SPP1 gp7 family putative phage head morphogenesis protein
MYRAQKIAEPPLYVAEDTDEGELFLTDHEIAPLFLDPSEDFDFAELLSLTEAYRLITGSALWLKARDRVGRVGGLMPFSGDQVRTYAAAGRIYGRFEVLTNGSWRPYPPEDVVYFRDLNPGSWRTNLSRLDVALSHLDLGHQVARTVRNFMRRAMFPGGVVSPDKDWNPSPEEWAAYKAAVAAWHSGPANAGNPLVAIGGTTFSRAAFPLKELLPTEILDRTEAVVGSVFGVAPIVLGWKVGLENSPWSQMLQARQNVYEETLVPRWGEYGRQISRQMLTPEERAAGVRVRFDLTDLAALRADDADRSTVSQTNREIWTVNERRAYTGQQPLPKDDPRGDELGGATQAGGLGLFGAASELGALALAGHPGGEVSGGLVKAFEAAYARGDEGPAGLEGKALEWALFDTGTKAAESTWTRAAYELLQEQLRQISALAGKHIRAAKVVAAPDAEAKAVGDIDPESATEFIRALAEWIREKGQRQLSKGLYPLIVNTGTAGAKRAAAQVGLNFGVLQPGVLAYAQEEAGFLASVMGETTGKKVAAIVQRRLSAGGLLRDLRKDLQESAAFSRTRAQLVARTETARAWNGAARRSLSDYESSSDETVRVTKEWLTAGDDRVRDEHAGMEGEQRRIDEPFSNGLQEPSEPNCRCTSAFSLER